MKSCKIMVLNLPSPPGMDVNRDYAGGYGTAHRVDRQSYGHSFDLVFPVFMPYIASGLRRRGYEVKVLDAQAARLDSKAVIAEIRNERPVAVTSMLSLPSINGDMHMINRLKESFPDIVFVGLGTVTRCLAEEIFKKSKVDFLVDADYPLYTKPIVELLLSLQQKSEGPSRNIPGIVYRDGPNAKITMHNNKYGGPGTNAILDDLDITIYHEFDMHKYRLHFCDATGSEHNYFPILSSKGCPFSCTYCPYPIGFGRKILYKSPENLVNEIEFLNQNFGIRAFVFRDQVFTADKARVKRICDLILEKNLRVCWLFETRVDMISRDLLKQMRKAGCNRIHYGVETGNESLLRTVGRPKANRETIEEAFRNTAKEQIFTMAHIILGLPGETKETVESTYKFLLGVDPDCVSWNLVTPYPGTKLFELANENACILSHDWEKYNTEEIVMRTEALPGEELGRLRRELAARFRARKVARRVRRALSNKDVFMLLLRRLSQKLKHPVKNRF